MRIGSLFSGYGGLDLGVMDALGGEIAWHVESDEAPSRILAHHWPDVPNYGDVTAVNWQTANPIDVLTAGYPCQPFSVSGKRKGDQDERHLWPHVADAIRGLRPWLAILENVAGHLSLGFGRVLGDLAEAGYDTQWVCVPASAAGAPHRRERVFIAAYTADEPRRLGDGDHLRTGWLQDGPDTDSGARALAHADHFRGDWYRGTQYGRDESAEDRIPDAVWGRFASSIGLWERVTGRAAPWPGHPGGGVTTTFTEWMMGLPAGHVTDPLIGLTREQQAKALGNGVVPQHASLAVRTLLSTNHTNGSQEEQ